MIETKERNKKSSYNCRKTLPHTADINPFFQGVYRRYHLDGVEKGTARIYDSRSLAMYTYAANNTLILLDTNGLYYEYAQDSGRIGWYQDDNINNREEFSIGYAGKGTGINNPSMQGQGDSARGDTNFGPLGTGTYEMEFRESYTGTDSAGKKTNYKNVLLLFQDGDYTGKMIHGEGVTKEGKFDSSKGCIVTFDGKPAGVRKEMHNSGDNILKVVEHARDSEKMSYGQSRDQEKYRGAAAANAYNER